MDDLPTAELRSQPSLPQEVRPHAGGAAGHVLCNVHTLGMHFDEVFLVGRFCDQLGKLLYGFSRGFLSSGLGQEAFKCVCVYIFSFSSNTMSIFSLFILQNKASS